MHKTSKFGISSLPQEMHGKLILSLFFAGGGGGLLGPNLVEDSFFFHMSLQKRESSCSQSLHLSLPEFCFPF